GEVLAYRLRSGNSVLLHVVGEFGPSPVVAVLDWVGEEIPPVEEIKDFPLKTYRGRTDPYLVAVMSPKKKPFPADRIIQLPIRRKPHQRKITGGYGAILWKNLDAELMARFGVK